MPINEFEDKAYIVEILRLQKINRKLRRNIKYLREKNRKLDWKLCLAKEL